MPNCRTCNKLLHEEADFCPSCRDPDPIQKPVRWDHVAFAILISLVVGAYLGLFR